MDPPGKASAHPLTFSTTIFLAACMLFCMIDCMGGFFSDTAPVEFLNLVMMVGKRNRNKLSTEEK